MQLVARGLMLLTLGGAVFAGSGCVATGAICASWLAAPCIICFGDGTQDPNGRNQAAMSLETNVADATAASSTGDVSMTY